jgi:hypothetical protein
MLPLAHVGHYLWILYVLPVLIVIAGILRSAIKERQTARTQVTDERAVRGNPATDSDEGLATPEYLTQSPEHGDAPTPGGTGEGPRTDKPARPQGPPP